MENITSDERNNLECGETCCPHCARCPCMACCPLETAMNLIGGKWRASILCALHRDGTTRYSELKRKIHGVTSTMLAAALKELEEHGLVSRKQYAEMPIRVEYSLTEACGELLPILGKLAVWGTAIQNKTLRPDD
jgi:DNA-binding HxlR family transcriptional regulator